MPTTPAIIPLPAYIPSLRGLCVVDKYWNGIFRTVEYIARHWLAYPQRIIEYGEANGSFRTAEEIVNAKAIRGKNLGAFRDYITVGP